MKRAIDAVIPIAACVTAMMAGCLTVGAVAASADAEKPVIVAFGDSLTAGYELPAGDSFPSQLQAALNEKGYAVEVMNSGVSGDTASGGLSRFAWAVPDDADGVILELGANDALRGLNPAATKTALAAIIDKAKAKNIPILLAGMEAPRNLGEEYVEEFRAVYADLAKEYDLLFYPFFLEGVARDESLTLPDGLHPNAKGVAKIVEGILPKVEELLTEVKARRQAAAPQSPQL